MTWIALLLLILVLPVIYLLTAPLYIRIDTKKGLYHIKLHRLFSFAVLDKAGVWETEIRFMWWTIKPGATPGNKKPRQPRKKRNPVAWRKILAVLKSFELKKFHVTFDTGDVATNGVFYPWIWLLGYWYKRDISINFEGKNEVIIELKNTLGRMAWAYIRTKK